LFDKILKELMNETNTTQRMLADAIGVTRQTISLYSKGKTLPDIYTVAKIANYFNVSLDYLAGKADRLDDMPIESLEKERNSLKYEIWRLRKAIDKINNILETY